MDEKGAAFPNSNLDIKLDKPFIYAITEYNTGAILFIGVQNAFGEE